MMILRLVRLLTIFLCLAVPAPLFAAFGLSTATDSYTVDTGANLVFKVRRTDNGSSTQSAGDIMSLVYNGVEYQNTSRGSQITSGFDYLYAGVSAVTVSAAVINTDYIRITVVAGNLTHYYMARNGQPHIYMATYFTTEPDIHGLCRYIVRIPEAKLPNGPVPSDIRNNTGAIESGDIFGMADGTTRSKHYSNMRLKDWSYIGATGTNVGAWMLRSNHEGDSGGPFYRSLLNQCGGDQEITYIINYGEAQTEAFRTNILNGPYVLAFNNGAAPTAPDTTWVANMGLTGYIGASGRGAVTGASITGRDTVQTYTVGFANTTAQYWTDAAAGNGAFTMAGMIPGTYTMKVYKKELAVYTAPVTVTAGATTALGSIAITTDPSTTAAMWRIGNWDGTPQEFLNGDKITTMHPSDVRMAAWTPGTYVVGTSSPTANMPCYQWKDVNGSQAIQFQLTAGQVVASTVRVGLTCAFEGARPKISVNSWTYPSNPAASSQPDTRTLTVGTYRGNNVTYTFAVPASALVVGTNTLYVFPISGSGAAGFLSAGYSVDCIDMYQGAAQTVAFPGAPGALTAIGGYSGVSLAWSATAVAQSYSVSRSTTSGGPYTVIASGLTALSHVDTTTVGGIPYYYVVNATNTSGSGLNSNEAAATAAGLAAFYPLTGDAQDASGNSNHGTATALTYPPEGTGTRTGLFNGTSSHVVIPRVVQDDFTVALWLKTTSTGGSGTSWWQGDGLVDGEISGARADWGMSLLGGKLAFGIGNPDTTAFSTGLINDGSWHHIAATRNNASGTVQIFIDGLLQTTASAPTGSRTAPPNLRIGSLQTGSATGFLPGNLSGVRLYNKILSPAEVSSLAALPAAPAGLTAIAADGHVDLNWQPVAGATGYQLKRATTPGGPYTVILAGNSGVTSMTDNTASYGTTYHYVATSVVNVAESPPSPEATATPLSAIQSWRLANFGTFTNEGEAANDADPDHDGTLNETEFRLGLNPKDGASAFVANGSATSSGYEITWPSATGLTFEIRRTLIPDAGEEVVGTVTGQGTFKVPLDPSGKAFYRVALLP